MNKLVLLTTIFAVLATSAQAQETKAKRWRGQIGIGLSTSESGKRFVGSTAGSATLSYDLGRVGQGTWGLYSDSIMRSRERDNATGGGTTTTSQAASGFGVQYRLSQQTLYYGIGVGGYNLTTASAVQNGDTTVTTRTDKMVFGGRVFVGRDFSKRYFGELGYTFLGQTTLGATKVNASHLTLGVGRRF
jgi:OmpA-like transmembrane domain